MSNNYKLKKNTNTSSQTNVRNISPQRNSLQTIDNSEHQKQSDYNKKFNSTSDPRIKTINQNSSNNSIEQSLFNIPAFTDRDSPIPKSKSATPNPIFTSKINESKHQSSDYKNQTDVPEILKSNHKELKQTINVATSFNHDMLKDMLISWENRIKNDFDERHSTVVTYINDMLTDSRKGLNDSLLKYFSKFNHEQLIKSIVSEVHKLNESKLNTLSNDMKTVKTILADRLNDNGFNSLHEKQEKNPVIIKLDSILKEFNVLKSYKANNGINYPEKSDTDMKLNEAIKKIDTIYTKNESHQKYINEKLSKISTENQSLMNLNSSIDSTKIEINKLESFILQSENNLTVLLEKINKQLDNTPLNYISNDNIMDNQPNYEFQDQIEAKLNENTESINTTLSNMRNSINKAIHELHSGVNKQISEQKTEQMNHMSSISSSISEMNVKFNKSISSMHSSVKNMSDNIDLSSSHSIIDKVKSEISDYLEKKEADRNIEVSKFNDEFVILKNELKDEIQNNIYRVENVISEYIAKIIKDTKVESNEIHFQDIKSKMKQQDENIKNLFSQMDKIESSIDTHVVNQLTEIKKDTKNINPIIDSNQSEIKEIIQNNFTKLDTISQKLFNDSTNNTERGLDEIKTILSSNERMGDRRSSNDLSLSLNNNFNGIDSKLSQFTNNIESKLTQMYKTIENSQNSSTTNTDVKLEQVKSLLDTKIFKCSHNVETKVEQLLEEHMLTLGKYHSIIESKVHDINLKTDKISSDQFSISEILNGMDKDQKELQSWIQNINVSQESVETNLQDLLQMTKEVPASVAVIKTEVQNVSDNQQETKDQLNKFAQFITNYDSFITNQRDANTKITNLQEKLESRIKAQQEGTMQKQEFMSEKIAESSNVHDVKLRELNLGFADNLSRIVGDANKSILIKLRELALTKPTEQQGNSVNNLDFGSLKSLFLQQSRYPNKLLQKETSASPESIAQALNSSAEFNVKQKYSNYMAFCYKGVLFTGQGKLNRECINNLQSVQNGQVVELQIENKPSPRFGMAQGVQGNKLYFQGGCTDRNNQVGDFYSLDLDTLDTFELILSDSIMGSKVNARMACVGDSTPKSKKVAWFSGGISKSQTQTELIGWESATGKFLKSNCRLSERQCHLMTEVDDGMILVGFGWFNKNSLNDLYLFNSRMLELVPIKIANLKPDNGMDCQVTRDEIVVQGGQEHGLKLTFDRGDLNKYKLQQDESIKMAQGRIVNLGNKNLLIKNSHNNVTDVLDLDL